MPVISYFFGIYIRMYHDDHNPPHCHVEYQGHEALVDITTGTVTEGHIPNKAKKIVKEWILDNRASLMENCEKAVLFEPLHRIKGADND